MKQACVFLLFGAVAMGHAYSNNSLPPRSFIVAPVYSTQDLLRQLENPRVLLAYQTHYGANRAELETFFRSLFIRKYGKNERALLYFWDGKSKSSGAKLHKMRASEIVFGSKSGVPMLMTKCGNPFGKRIWLPTSAEITQAKAPQKNVLGNAVEEKPVVAETKFASPAEIIDAVVNQPVVTLEPTMELATLPAATFIEPIAGATTAPIIGQVAAAGGGLGLLAGLATAFGGVALIQGGGGPSTISAVPEPGAMIALGFGITMMLASRRKRL